MALSDLFQPGQYIRTVHLHAAGPKHQRLDQQGGDTARTAETLEHVQCLLFAARLRKSQPVDAEEQRFVRGIEHAALTC
ncbi:hypothetical protein D3C71_1542310 [compost metagenome]